MFIGKLIAVFLWVFFCSIVFSPLFMIMYGRFGFLPRLVRLWSWGVLSITGIRVVIEGPAIADNEPLVIIANHQSALDVIVFAKVIPRKATMVAKRELRRIPVLGSLFEFAGVILIDRSHPQRAKAMLQESVAKIRRHRLAVVIAPEGTRNTVCEQLLPFKKGGFHMAIEGKLPIVPVVCSRIENVVSFNLRRFGPGTIRVKVLDRIETAHRTAAGVDELVAGVYRQMQEALTGLG